MGIPFNNAGGNRQSNREAVRHEWPLKRRDQPTEARVHGFIVCRGDQDKLIAAETNWQVTKASGLGDTRAHVLQQQVRGAMAKVLVVHLEMVKVNDGNAARRCGWIGGKACNLTLKLAAIAKTGEAVVRELMIAISVDAMPLNGNGGEVDEVVNKRQVFGSRCTAITVVHAEHAQEASISTQDGR